MLEKSPLRASLTAALVACTVLSATSFADELIVNGGFETGNLSGWTEVNQEGGWGSWYISTPGANTPISGKATALNPSGGSYYAVADQNGPGSHVLLQSFTVPLDATSLTLSYRMFVNDYDSGPYNNGLDYTVIPTENARVDILTATAGAFSTAPVDIVENLYSGADEGSSPNPYTSYSFNLTSLTPGDTYQLRFAEADNQSFFNMGIDNVSIQATLLPVPEPSTFALLSAGAIG